MKKRILATALSLAVGLTAAVGLSACSKPENPIVVGYTVYAPMNYKENGKLVGFDTEFAEMALEELGYTPVFQIIDWDNKVFELQTNQIDLIWNGMTITDELKENIAITDSYMKNLGPISEGCCWNLAIFAQFLQDRGTQGLIIRQQLWVAWRGQDNKTVH